MYLRFNHYVVNRKLHNCYLCSVRPLIDKKQLVNSYYREGSNNKLSLLLITVLSMISTSLTFNSCLGILVWCNRGIHLSLSHSMCPVIMMFSTQQTSPCFFITKFSFNCSRHITFNPGEPTGSHMTPCE